MHFSKTYTQVLNSLPPDMRENAIEYRQLKKLINSVVEELSSLSLTPTTLHSLFASTESLPLPDGSADATGHTCESARSARTTQIPKVVYELKSSSTRIEPRLKLFLDIPKYNPSLIKERQIIHGSDDGSGSDEDVDGVEHLISPRLTEFAHRLTTTNHTSFIQYEAMDPPQADGTSRTLHDKHLHEFVIIPLLSDSEFFQMLSDALKSLSLHLISVQAEFNATLEDLSRTISDSARPASTYPRFHPHSGLTSHPGSVRVHKSHLTTSDLYIWREIFQLYIEAEIFESVSEISRGERSFEESEKRLKLFTDRAMEQLGDGKSFKLKGSRKALETFLSINLYILNIKKFSYINAEGTRKILKKHAKRTSLPFPGLSETVFFSLSTSDFSSSQLALVSHPPVLSFPRLLVQAVGEKLLPVIPHLDDYTCLICTSIAFKPIRLNCRHLFCVRCLVKMQKRGKANCPICRAPCVLVADQSNVDWALLNFMEDWFPKESREKLKSNEREATQEQLAELGLNSSQACIIM